MYGSDPTSLAPGLRKIVGKLKKFKLSGNGVKVIDDEIPAKKLREHLK